MPVLQRSGGGACGSDGPNEGMWAMNVGGGTAQQGQGAVAGNVLFVVIAWGTLSLCGVCIARWWHHDETMETQSLEAVRSAHVASLWAPLMSMVLVPVTANSVSLLRREDATGVAGLAVVAAYLTAIPWICVTARSRLHVESVLPRKAEQLHVVLTSLMGRLTLYLSILVQEHWAAPNEQQKGAVEFKRHAQVVLSQATAWWYCPLEATLGVAVGVADGAGSCAWSVGLGVAAQFLLAVIVAWRAAWRAHWALGDTVSVPGERCGVLVDGCGSLFLECCAIVRHADTDCDWCLDHEPCSDGSVRGTMDNTAPRLAVSKSYSSG